MAEIYPHSKKINNFSQENKSVPKGIIPKSIFTECSQKGITEAKDRQHQKAYLRFFGGVLIQCVLDIRLVRAVFKLGGLGWRYPALVGLECILGWAELGN